MAGHIDEKTVAEVASLARLTLTDEEKTSYTKELESILEYMDRLHEAKVADTPPYDHKAIEIAQARTDVPRAFEDRAALLPEGYFQDNLMVTKGVFERHDS